MIYYGKIPGRPHDKGKSFFGISFFPGQSSREIVNVAELTVNLAYSDKIKRIHVL